MDKRSHWASINESGTLLGMKILLGIYRLFGRTAFRVVLWPLMVYYYLSRSVARGASGEYLQRMRAQVPEQLPAKLAGLRHFVTFGESILDKFLVWMGRISREDVSFEDEAAISQLDKSRQGGLIVVSHLGNIEICRALAYHLPDIRLTILVHTRHAAKFNALLAKMAPEAPIDLMQVTEMTPATAMLLSERVEAGEYVVIAGDRTPVNGEERVSRVNFLGAQAPFPQGPFILASLLRCPVFLMFCLKQKEGYRIYLEPFADRVELPRKSRQQALDTCVQQFATRLEHYAMKAPLQWFNFFPFWGEQPVRSDAGPEMDESNGFGHKS
ncbi:LpxL/LpxP family acyltransferase [Marinobacterium lutimaris]|uniref:Predicted acyltransferase, LPLAT superfamily n=1 Tax=Marinobacterium lutimaris TaxID=568106 RepID=A0A1H5TDS4_9GAMM|nr:lipid A biosynthesis acyltransferase [Marinobacterium lutimaris]SEF60167.1 Predicted acyltransferase, LPLAT superfamily [Marinobacterium lutimaris]